jgi:hypothetical protein
VTPSLQKIRSDRQRKSPPARIADSKFQKRSEPDAKGDKPGIVVAEIPAKPQWCELRKIVFGWTQVQFPFRVRSGRKLRFTQPPIITVIGKAFWDIGHAPKDQSNRRTDLQGYAAWEIHPVMKLTVQ